MATVKRIIQRIKRPIGMGQHREDANLIIDTAESIYQHTTGINNKGWRALILTHRATHQPSAKIDKVDPADNSLPSSFKKRDRESKAKNIPEITFNIKPHEDKLKLAKTLDNKVIIYNLFSSPYQYIELQNRPNTIDFKGETTWAAIKSMGRNTPMYHYTGSEDTVQFNISWYCNDPEHRDEVINKCRLLELWSKSNGYIASPPVLRIQWGKSGLFDNHKYILISATYSLSNFNDGYGSGDRNTVHDGKLLPSTATQELIFKRVSETNLTYEDILPVAKAEYTRGIGNS